MTPERFDDLVQEVRPALWRYLARRTDPEAAADALADTLLVLWRRRADIPAVDPLPWCYRVARGALGNTARSARRQRGEAPAAPCHRTAAHRSPGQPTDIGPDRT